MNRSNNSSIKRILFQGLLTLCLVITHISAFTPSQLPNQNSKINHTRNSKRPSPYQKRKTQWIGQSLNYYNTVMREEERKQKEETQKLSSSTKSLVEQRRTNLITAQRLYFARQKIKTGSLHQAERIYRKLIQELMSNDEEELSCHHAQLAVSTLLLSLLLQRQGNIPETRKTFVTFFRIISKKQQEQQKQGAHVEECTCSAKVMQAFALFEMKQGNVKKSYSLARMAVTMDPALAPVLQWKQFRDARKTIHPTSPLLR